MNEARGRRPGAPDTKAEILIAARGVFSEQGYDRTSVRAIAAAASVDPSLIYHYFGTKEDLFAASIDLPPHMLEMVRSIFDVEADELGASLASAFLSVWETEEARAPLLGILRSATGGESRAVISFREFLTNAILDQIAPRITGDDARLRALLMASHLVGIAMTRYVVQLEPIASAPVSQIVELVAPRIQSYVDSGA